MSKKIPQESVENLEVDLQDVALNTIHRSSDGSDHSKVTDNETAITSKADPVDISGTHTETVLTIDFSAIQGKIITLSADRAYAITGLSNSNPVGILSITHNGFIPTFSGITELERLLDKSGIYYLKFVRQADGTIIQVNQIDGIDSGIVEKIQSNVISETEILSLNTTPIIIKLAPGNRILDNPIDAWIYLNYKTAYSTFTVIELLSGSTVVGTIDVLGLTASGWYPFILSGAAEDNANLSIRALTGNPVGGSSDIILDLNYIKKDASGFIFYIVNDDFLTMQPWTDSSVPDGWTKGGTHNATNKVTEDINGLKYETDGTYTEIRKNGILTVGNTYDVEIDVTSVTGGGFVFYVGGANIIINAAGIIKSTVTANLEDYISLKRNSGNSILVCRSIIIK